MKCWVGIDLGSTTTKAVVLDENEDILGKGITNSRNNYDAACAIARTEAMIDARFTLVRRELGGRGEGRAEATAAGGELLGIRSTSESFVESLARAFRLEQYLYQLRILRDTALKEVEGIEARRCLSVLSDIFHRMEEEAPGFFVPGAAKRSDFFRDIAGSRFLSIAEEVAPSAGVPFDVLMGLFDKSILKVENRPIDLSFEAHIKDAVDRAVSSADRMSDSRRMKVKEAVERAAAAELDIVSSVGTGYGRARLPFPRENIRSEILCHGLGAHVMFPRTATVLDIGGQDTKAIQVDSAGIVTSFQMNDRCAAGCGRYLGYIADEMNLGLHELGPMAQTSTLPVKISSTCTVFAGAEIRDRLAIGQKREDILAGLHRAIILRALSLLARSGGIDNEFTFTGGVAKNPAAVAALRRLVQENYGELQLNISPDSIYTGSLGAALFALRGTRGNGESRAEGAGGEAP